MAGTPKSNRPHIALFGRRNVGKSSLINMITSQALSIVSAKAGTTTDPVEKAMEFFPFGPVVFIDTAGLDDKGELGRLRTRRSAEILRKTDIAVLVVDGDVKDSDRELMQAMDSENIPFVLVFNKCDLPSFSVERCRSWNGVPVSAKTGAGVARLKNVLQEMLKGWSEAVPLSLTAGLVRPGGVVVLVVPIDSEAPVGRLILPQVQTIRDVLDADAFCVVVKERELGHCLKLLGKKPDIVITDSQAFLKVAADVPADVPLTSFSILFARQKGNLALLASGARKIDDLKDGDTVLISEACTHHAMGDDIGTVKIPRLLRQYTGKKLNFSFDKGKSFDVGRDGIALIVHCGGCMLNPRAMVSRMNLARSRGIPMTNYGMTIAFTLGIFEQALRPFGILSAKDVRRT